jgi:hypothetical protein
MPIHTQGENKIGYKVTVWSSTGKTTSYRGFSEGSPLLNNSVKATLIKAIPTKALTTLVSGGFGVSAVFATAGFAGNALGQTISALLLNGLNQALLRKAGTALATKQNSIGVTIAGDFQASYKIQSLRDLNALPGLLSIIPATFKVQNKPYWMGADIIRCLINEQIGACITGENINVRYTVDV